MKSDCTLIISSCDAYSDIWDAFFTLLHRNWDIPYHVMLNTETLSYQTTPKVQTVPSAPGTCWTRRLQNAVRTAKTEFVLVLLDDFFITSPMRPKKQMISFLGCEKGASTHTVPVPFCWLLLINCSTCFSTNFAFCPLFFLSRSAFHLPQIFFMRMPANALRKQTITCHLHLFAVRRRAVFTNLYKQAAGIAQQLCTKPFIFRRGGQLGALQQQIVK